MNICNLSIFFAVLKYSLLVIFQEEERVLIEETTFLTTHFHNWTLKSIQSLHAAHMKKGDLRGQKLITINEEVIFVNLWNITKKCSFWLRNKPRQYSILHTNKAQWKNSDYLLYWCVSFLFIVVQRQTLELVIQFPILWIWLNKEQLEQSAKNCKWEFSK